MSRKQRGKGRSPGTTEAQPGAQGGRSPQPQTGAPAGGSWGPVRDAIKRDIEQGSSALAFAERLHERLDTQRRLFLDFPRVMEQLRSGALERLTGPLARLFEGGQGVDLTRFLRDLPLALSHLAQAEAQARKATVPAAAKDGAGKVAQEAPPLAEPLAEPLAGSEAQSPSEAAHLSEAASAELPSGDAASQAPAGAAPAEAASAEELAPAPAQATAQPAPDAEPAPAPAAEAAPAQAAPAEAAGPVSPRIEMRSKLLIAAPQLAKAAQSYRRNVATVRRACTPRRSPGPWRSDREVLEESRRAIEFAQKLYDAYAEAWADAPLTAGLMDAMSAEADRFLAWTQLNRYVELAVHGPSGAPRAAQPVTEASPGAVVTSDPPAATAASAEPAAADSAPQEPAQG